MITGAQIRAARALSNWSTMVLSKRCKVPLTILWAAQADGVPRLHLLLVEYLAHGALDQLAEASMVLCRDTSRIRCAESTTYKTAVRPLIT
jgi:hypothetical protein